MQYRSLALSGGAILILLTTVSAHASRFGRDGFSGNPASNGGATCTACHAPGARQPGISITGPANVSAGSTRRFGVTIRGGPGITGGVNISDSGVAGSEAHGTLTAAHRDLARVGGELSHARPKPFSGGEVSFWFDWTAPPHHGDVTLYAAGNSTNGNLDLLGDGVAATTMNVTVHGGTAPPPPPPAPPPPNVEVTPLATGFTRPVAVRHAGDERLFVVEQPGRIRIVGPDGNVRWPPFLDITSRVHDAGIEQGLLGLAFHPRYAENGFYYVYYTVDGGSGRARSRISRFRVSDGDPHRSWPGTERVLMEFEQPHANHNGGDLHFGPDGYLYIASGDGGSAGDPGNFAQNPRSPLGKLLRIDVNGRGGAPDCNLARGNHYGVPRDNAFADGPGKAGCDEIFALGLRNPWRFSFDRATGDLWIADVGQSAAEEVNRLPAGTAAGLNLGWRCFEGDRPFNTAGCNAAYVSPLHVLRHNVGWCSITGGFVYRGARAPSLYGRYFFSDFCRPALNTLTRDGSGVTMSEVLPAGHVTQPVSFGEDVHGELLVVSLTGEIYRIQPGESEAAPAGEAGAVTVRQDHANHWHRVAFQRAYQDPVVVMGPPTRNGGHPTVVRVRNVTATGFEFQLDEWDYLDGAHTGERVGYLVVERGSHRLGDGRRLVAGRAWTNHGWQAVHFGERFPAAPVVVSQAASRWGGQAVTERVRNVGAGRFEVRLQEEEANDGFHAGEAVHWIAVEPGAATGLEAGLVRWVDHNGALVSLARSHTQPPVLISGAQTTRGADPAALRVLTNDGTTIGLMVEEEQSQDWETGHLGEDLGYLVVLRGFLE